MDKDYASFLITLRYDSQSIFVAINTLQQSLGAFSSIWFTHFYMFWKDLESVTEYERRIPEAPR